MDEIVGHALGALVVHTGRLVVWMISFGQWRGESWLGNEARVHGLAGALSFVRDGKRVITETGLMFFGAVFWMARVVLLIVLLGKS